jgi:hypothetical protein
MGKTALSTRRTEAIVLLRRIEGALGQSGQSPSFRARIDVADSD